MKKIILIAIVSILSFTANAQEKNKNAKVTFEVDGVCGMCKKRIETAALKTKGVKFALWNVKTHQLNLIMDERKVEVGTVQQNIANVGHDIILKDKKITATLKAYNSVNPCCKYRDEKVVLEHEGGMKMHKKQN
jgi:periplasmic mercuric ion binding protein|uniref:heavy-metal-associated domain-containing protein n=1 Tax=uncultured Polaribacter sp. TaxID=174711 RepID=UPI00261ED71E|nr:cation transporter [uncultured Polaribacter sp.]